MSENNNVKTKNKVDTIKIVNIVAIILSVLLIPILIMNCILIVKGMVNTEEVPSIGKMTPLIVITESMEPTIMSGDLIICKKVDANEVNVDDVISFFDPEGNGSSVVTHRVIKLEYDKDGNLQGFRTQGDNNDIEDRLTVPVENLVGVWTEKRIGFLGHVVLFSQSTIGLIVCIFLPILAFVAYEVLRRKKQDKAKQDDIAALKAELEALKNNNTQAQPEQPEAQTENKTEETP